MLGFRGTLTLLALLAGAFSSAPLSAGAAFSFYGSNELGKTFNRPSPAGGTLTGKVVRYSIQPFFVDANATCRIESVQEGGFNGVIYLYRGAFDPAVPLTNMVVGNDNGPRGAGFSELLGTQLQVNQNYYLVTAGNEPASEGTFSSFISCTGATRILVGDGTLPANDGRYGELKNGRFRVSATWKNFAGETGVATWVPLGSEETGVFWFFVPSNFELMLKVIDGCGLNNRYWVFFAALTNVEFRITVRDTWADREKVYDNPLGVSAAAVTDTTFFQTCP